MHSMALRCAEKKNVYLKKPRKVNKPPRFHKVSTWKKDRRLIIILACACLAPSSTTVPYSIFRTLPVLGSYRTYTYTQSTARCRLKKVRARIDDIKCGICRQGLRDALDAGMVRGGFPLTKVVKLAACHGGEHLKLHARGQGGGATQGAADTFAASSGGGKNESLKTQPPGEPAGTADRLRVQAPVTPDLLRQIIGVVQTAAAAPGGTAAAVAAGSGVCRSGEVALGELTAEEWLTTYPAPTAALLSGQTANGIRGTGSGTLAVQRARPQGPEDTRNLWALMDRAERARDNAFKCCGVIKASTGVGLHDSSTGTGSAGGGGRDSNNLASMTSNIEWNPQFAPRLQDAETALVEWLTEVTMALHGLSFPFSVAFVTEPSVDGKEGTDGKSDLAETGALAEDLWTTYEESVKRQLELTLEARREQLREQSQPMGIALCFAAQNRACAAELLERKRAEMTALHDTTIGVLRAPERQPLLARSRAAREKWSDLLISEGCCVLDALVERALRARLQVCVCVCVSFFSRVKLVVFFFVLHFEVVIHTENSCPVSTGA